MGHLGLLAAGQGGYAQQVLSDGPVLYLPLFETSGSATQNFGTGSGACSFVGTVSRGGAGFRPGGSSISMAGGAEAGVLWASTAALQAACSLEVCFEATAGGTNTATFLIGKASYFAATATSYPICLRWNETTGKLGFGLERGNDFDVDLLLEVALSPGVAYHAIGTYAANGTAYLYVDGEEAASGSFPHTISNGNTEQWRVGHARGNGGGAGKSGFKGRLGEPAIYASQLSAARVSAHFAALAG